MESIGLPITEQALDGDVELAFQVRPDGRDATNRRQRISRQVTEQL